MMNVLSNRRWYNDMLNQKQTNNEQYRIYFSHKKIGKYAGNPTIFLKFKISDVCNLRIQSFFENLTEFYADTEIGNLISNLLLENNYDNNWVNNTTKQHCHFNISFYYDDKDLRITNDQMKFKQVETFLTNLLDKIGEKGDIYQLNIENCFNVIDMYPYTRRLHGILNYFSNNFDEPAKLYTNEIIKMVSNTDTGDINFFNKHTDNYNVKLYYDKIQKIVEDVTRWDYIKNVHIRFFHFNLIDSSESTFSNKFHFFQVSN